MAGAEQKADKRALKREVMAEVAKAQAILRRWDPIGIAPGEFGPADEYDEYATRIVAMVREGCSLEALCRQLEHVRTAVIGVERDDAHDRAIAGELLRALRGE